MLNVNELRQQFPALHKKRDGHTPIFLDGPAGTQVPRQCIDAIVQYLTHCNANHGGYFATSVDSDEILQRAHDGMAAFVNAPSPDEIIFGPNMTTLTLHLSRAIGRTLAPGDEIIVTRLDHDANVRPWILAARDAEATVRWVDIHKEDCTLDMDDLRRQITERTKLIAVTCASNLVGSLVNVTTVCQWGHAVGAKVFLDAVHYAPHGLIDVQAWDCDFLACSPYKFFGPHLGVLWGRRQWLEELPVYKLNPASDDLPGRWMTGTQNHECLAGLTGTLDYLQDLGTSDSAASLRQRLQTALAAIQQHETTLAQRLLQGLADLPRIRVHGIADVNRLDQRVPTISFTHREMSPADVARRLATHHIYSWNGNSYAEELSKRLGLEPTGGTLRLGLVHYNTMAEVDTVISRLAVLKPNEGS